MYHCNMFYLFILVVVSGNFWAMVHEFNVWQGVQYAVLVLVLLLVLYIDIGFMLQTAPSPYPAFEVSAKVISNQPIVFSLPMSGAHRR